MRTQQSKIFRTLGKKSQKGNSQHCRPIYLYIKEKAQINNLTLHLKELEKEQQTKPNVSRRKETIKIRAEINEINSLKNDTKDQ